MNGILLANAIWIVVAVTIVLVIAGIRHSKSGQPANNVMAGALSLVICVIFGIGIPVILLANNHANANTVGGVKLTASEQRGHAIFAKQCAVCHTLAAANAVGEVGFNLDTLKPSAEIVTYTLAQGITGQGTMPANIVQGHDAQDVANYVAAVAGKH